MRLNDLRGKAWVKLSKNVWITQKLLAWRRRTPLQRTSTFLTKKRFNRKSNMNYRPLDDSRVKLIELFTQQGQRVCDPDLQSGDTLTAALTVDREFIGIGQTQTQCDEVESHLPSMLKAKSYRLFGCDHYPNMLTTIQTASIDFLLTELPAFDFKHQAHNYSIYLKTLKERLQAYTRLLKPNAYLAVIVADQRYQHRYYCCHADVIMALNNTQLILQGIINVIEDSQALKAYGYPTTYVPNIINRFVIIAKN